MTVISPRATRTDIARSVVVALLTVGQIVVAALVGGAIGPVAQAYSTPLLVADWTFALWVLIYAAFGAYAVYQALPGQRIRQVHRHTGWWLAASAAFNAGWLLSFAAGWLPLAELMIIGLLVVLAGAFGRLSRMPADSVTERVVLRGTVAAHAGAVSILTPLATAATGAWIGLPSTGALAAIAAVVVLLAVTAVVSWAVLAGTAVVPFAAAVVWVITGIALNDGPAAVVVGGAVAIVIVIAATARRITTAGFPVRAAWG